MVNVQADTGSRLFLFWRFGGFSGCFNDKVLNQIPSTRKMEDHFQISHPALRFSGCNDDFVESFRVGSRHGKYCPDWDLWDGVIWL